MLAKASFLSFALIFALALPICGHGDDVVPASSSQLDREMGKEGAIWENYFKFVVFIEGGKPARLVYQDLNQFELHRDFLATQPQFRGKTRNEIERLTYAASPDRKAYLGVLVIHAGDDAIHRSRFSLATAEAPTAEVVAAIHKLVQKSAGDKLGTAFDFELLPHQEKGFLNQIESLRGRGISLYESTDVASSVSYTEAWNVGVLVAVANQEELDAKIKSGKINSNSIVFAREALRDIPPVAGVISAVPLTPASHTVLASQMYGVPVAYFKDAEQIFKPFIGKRVFLSAHGSPELPMNRRLAEFSVNPSAADLKMLTQLKAKAPLTAPFEPNVMEIRPVETLTQKDVGAYGGKSSQMGALMRLLPKNSVSKALGIPVGFSVNFLRTAKATNGKVLSTFIESQLKLVTDNSTPEQIDQIMTGIQNEIKGAKFPAQHLQYIVKTLREYFPGASVKVRFRSTGNVEDGNEFNGAGLYDSTGVWLSGEKPDDIEKKLKKVIASLYNRRAYMARRKFGVDEARVGMGILVHPAFQDEVGNGVLRLISDKSRERFHFEIVTLKGDEDQVTHATSARSAEVVSGIGWFPSEVLDRLTVEQPYEGNSKQRKLFPSQVYLDLAAHMAKVAAEYDRRGDIDIESEFKIMPASRGKHNVFLKQVRRVPHPKVQPTSDGSQYVVLGGRVVLTSNGMNNPEAFADLWLPKKIELDIPTFTESQLRRGQVSVRSARVEIRGRTYTINNPKVDAKLKGGDLHGYGLTIHLPTDVFPSLHVNLSNDSEKLDVHSLTSPKVYVLANVENDDVKFMSKSISLPRMDAIYDTSLVGQVLATAQPAHTGRILFAVAGSQKVRITGEETLFYGEGDGRSIRIGLAKIEGVFSRTLNVPGPAIGYGANHHSGEESFVFDLFADPDLTVAERRQLGQTVGRYLYAVASADSGDGSQTLLIKESGDFKTLGRWRSREIKFPAGKECPELLVSPK